MFSQHMKYRLLVCVFGGLIKELFMVIDGCAILHILEQNIMGDSN